MDIRKSLETIDEKDETRFSLAEILDLPNEVAQGNYLMDQLDFKRQLRDLNYAKTN